MSHRPTASVGNPVVKQLLDDGIIPQMCIGFTLECRVDDAVTMTSEVYVTQEQFQKIADALSSNPEEAKRIARRIIFKSMDDSGQAPISVDL